MAAKYAIACVVMMVAAVTWVDAQQPARDPRPQQSMGTATIGGRVMTTGESPVTVRRARVTVTSTDMTHSRVVMTNDAGEFSVANVPAGRYTVSAAKPGFVRVSYGAAQPGRSGTAVVVTTGQRLDNLLVKLAPGAVITGVITDMKGRPVQGVGVRLLQFRLQGGERSIGPVSITPGSTGEVTDDLGVYRLFALPPGEYVIAAVSPASPVGAVTYVPVYYPGTIDPSAAATVSVKSGEELSDINLRLQYVKTARVAGMVVAPGPVKRGDIQATLVPLGTMPVSLGTSTGIQSLSSSIRSTALIQEDGSFAFEGVVPGRYAIQARLRTIPDIRTLDPSTSFASVVNSASHWATAEIAVNGVDVAGVTLTLRTGVTVSGRVVIDSAISPQPPFTRARVSLNAQGESGGGIRIATDSTAVSPNAAGEFTMSNVFPGRYRPSASFASGSPSLGFGWGASSAMLNGRDLLDFPLEVRPDENVDGLVVTLSDREQRVSGALRDASGRPSTDYTIVLFPADRALWTSSRRLRTSRPAVDGHYAISDIPAGDYRLAAVSDLAPGQSNDPAFLETLVATSVVVGIKSGESKIQNLSIAR